VTNTIVIIRIIKLKIKELLRLLLNYSTTECASADGITTKFNWSLCIDGDA